MGRRSWRRTIPGSASSRRSPRARSPSRRRPGWRSWTSPRSGPASARRRSKRVPEALMPTALLALEDGTTFAGESFGARGETSGEVVFNTSMTGYQEIVTDPSYTGQIVAMTYPLIGNYGVNADDVESDKPHVEA